MVDVPVTLDFIVKVPSYPPSSVTLPHIVIGLLIGYVPAAILTHGPKHARSNKKEKPGEMIASRAIRVYRTLH